MRRPDRGPRPSVAMCALASMPWITECYQKGHAETMMMMGGRAKTSACVRVHTFVRFLIPWAFNQTDIRCAHNLSPARYHIRCQDTLCCTRHCCISDAFHVAEPEQRVVVVVCRPARPHPKTTKNQHVYRVIARFTHTHRLKMHGEDM